VGIFQFWLNSENNNRSFTSRSACVSCFHCRVTERKQSSGNITKKNVGFYAQHIHSSCKFCDFHGNKLNMSGRARFVILCRTFHKLIYSLVTSLYIQLRIETEYALEKRGKAGSWSNSPVYTRILDCLEILCSLRPWIWELYSSLLLHRYQRYLQYIDRRHESEDWKNKV
jgi:hypothetical protein